MDVVFRSDGHRCWIGLPTIDCHPSSAPAWLRDFFPELPWRVAQAGDDGGYLILEYPANFDLRTLPVPDYGLRRRTLRSLIVTCADEENSGVDIQLRYFAPQHGVPEDTATGSAMRVLASYWLKRELGNHLCAYQCSPDGGLLFSEHAGATTWVGAHVDGPYAVGE
ncbi:MAG: hypothetical protein Cons2KO_14590 [Congregibacter sp.]